MRIQLNDKPMDCQDNLTLERLLKQQCLMKPEIALAVNHTIVPREQWESHLLNDGDQILLFQAIAGG